MTNDELWRAALGEIEVQISKANFNTWFKNTRIMTLETGGTVVIGVPNIFNKEWLERKYNECIIKSLRHLGAPAREIRYLVQAPPASAERSSEPGERRPGQAPAPAKRPAPAAQLELASARANSEPQALNSRYSFETFVVGPFNELAHAAASAVAQTPGKKYNPLFIYGGVGLGKTHLLQAIGNALAKNQPRSRVVYCTSERFTSDLVKSIKSQMVEKFKNQYRATDVLIIDDIQFIAGKEKTQEELFHIFNALHDAGKQIVFSADKPPKAIPMLEERLRSRFEGGMPVDIGFPEYESRVAILQKKLEEKGALLPEPVIGLIANRVTQNVRELEGALNKILSVFELSGSTQDPARIEAILADFGASAKATTSFKSIIESVARHFDVRADDILKKTRKKEVVTPRQVVMFLLRQELNQSFPAIGRRLGGKDHTTVMHACNKISQLMERGDQIKRDIEIIKERLYNY